MTTYRLLNDVHEFHEAFIDFRTMRRQLDGVKVWFPQKNETLLDKLKQDWVPVKVTFESARKNNAKPDLSVWNSSCLIMSDRARLALEHELTNSGEWLPLEENYWLFNCLTSVQGDVINSSESSFTVDSDGTLNMPRKLTLLEEKINGLPLFKPGFSHNSFLVCQDSFKAIADKHSLGGLHFEPDLARIFLPG